MKKDIYKPGQGISRRDLLATSALGGLALAIPAVAIAQQPLAVTPLRNDIHLIEGAGCHVVVAIGPESVLVVDGGLQDMGNALISTIGRLAGDKPVTTLFNTNWRPHHCGLNYNLGPAGATIIAHENTRLWQGNDFAVDWEQRHYRPMPASSQANDTYYEPQTLVFGQETVKYGHIDASHTDGDMYVHFQNANIMIAGDMLTVSTYPILDYVTGGWIGGAQRCTSGLLEMVDTDTLIVPGEGDPGRRDVLELQRDMLELAYARVSDAYRNGRSLEQFMASSPMAEYDAQLGNSALFTELLYRGAWYHVTSRAIPGII